MTSVDDGSRMPSSCNYSRQNTSDSCSSLGKSDMISDTVAVTVNGSAYNGESNSNSLDRSVCSSLGADEVASCSANEDFSASVADPDEQALLEKLQHANRFVMLPLNNLFISLMINVNLLNRPW